MSNNTPQPIFNYFLAFWYPLFTIIFFDNILIFLYFIFFKREKNLSWGITQKWVMTTFMKRKNFTKD
jgi:hypothetical protein